MQQRGTEEESNFAYIDDLLGEEMEEITFSGVLCRRGEIRRQLSAANKQKKRLWMNQQHEETDIKTQNSVFLVCKCQVSERLSLAANLESYRMTENLTRRICCKCSYCYCDINDHSNPTFEIKVQTAVKDQL